MLYRLNEHPDKNSLEEWSRGLARTLGECQGRTFSRVEADGLVNLTGGRISSETAERIVHGGIIGGGLLGMPGKVDWRTLLGWGLGIGSLLWILGQRGE